MWAQKKTHKTIHSIKVSPKFCFFSAHNNPFCKINTDTEYQKNMFNTQGHFLKWWSQSSSFSIINHLAIGVSPFLETPTRTFHGEFPSRCHQNKQPVRSSLGNHASTSASSSTSSDEAKWCPKNCPTDQWPRKVPTIYKAYVRGYTTIPKYHLMWYSTCILGSWNPHWTVRLDGDSRVLRYQPMVISYQYPFFHIAAIAKMKITIVRRRGKSSK